VVEENNENMM